MIARVKSVTPRANCGIPKSKLIDDGALLNEAIQKEEPLSWTTVTREKGISVQLAIYIEIYCTYLSSGYYSTLPKKQG